MRNVVLRLHEVDFERELGDSFMLRSGYFLGFKFQEVQNSNNMNAFFAFLRLACSPSLATLIW